MDAQRSDTSLSTSNSFQLAFVGIGDGVDGFGHGGLTGFWQFVDESSI